MSYKKRVIIFLSVMAVLVAILVGAFYFTTKSRLQNVNQETIVPQDFPEIE